MKTARGSDPRQVRNELPRLEPGEVDQEIEILAWEPLEDDLWLPHRIRGSWRGGVLG
jgi:hypothetical protein